MAYSVQDDETAYRKKLEDFRLKARLADSWICDACVRMDKDSGKLADSWEIYGKNKEWKFLKNIEQTLTDKFGVKTTTKMQDWVCSRGHGVTITVEELTKINAEKKVS